MSLTLTTYNVAGGILTIDASVASPATYKIQRYWVLCNGLYADECSPVYERWSGSQLTMTTARRVSTIDLSNYPNGSLTFTLYARHKKTTSSAVTDETPISITVENTWNVPLKVPAATTYRVFEEPVVTVFDMPDGVVPGGVIPITLSAKDNKVVTAYLVKETATTPLSDDTAWATNVTEYPLTSNSGTITLYAWAKDADGNISDRVSSATTILVPAALPRGGRYQTGQTVTLTDPAGGIMLYTTDGSDPRNYIVTDNGLAQFDNGVLQTTGEVN